MLPSRWPWLPSFTSNTMPFHCKRIEVACLWLQVTSVIDKGKNPLDIANADPSAGALVIADQCTGSTSQQWELDGAGHIFVSKLSGYCITEGNAGAQLTMQECTDDGDTQMWTLPELPVLP